jgi:hypothetical protein
MDTININDIPVENKPFESSNKQTKGSFSKKEVGFEFNSNDVDVGIMHKFSPPNFSLSLELWPELKEGYSLKIQATNYGHLTKIKQELKNHICRNCKLPIAILAPLYRLTRIESIEYSEDRKYYRTWLFGNEDCLRDFLNNNNPEWML